MYTSGSTGEPKGVVVLHRNLSAYTAAIVELVDALARPLVFATTATLAADLGNTAVFPALVSGGALRVISYEAALDGALLAAELGGERLDVLKITPSNLGALLASAPDPLAVLPREALICGGEPLSWETVRRVRELGARCAAINHYGPTETTVGALAYRIGDDEAGAPGETVPIGAPLPGATAYVLDDELHPVAAGETGELYVGGTGVARGYAARPGETAARFLPDPFAELAGLARATMYRTGDRVTPLGDGRLAFVGRADGQVKIRGYRVEPGEIEAVLGAHPAVSAVAVAARDAGEPVLDAYVVGTAGADELRAYLAERLPDYMIPRTWTSLAVLPLTANGKLDRAALPQPAAADTASDGPAPSPTEAAVARIWAEVIGTPRVGRDDNFFELGGHSLTATIAVASIRAEFDDVELSLREFFRAPTVRAVAAHVDELLARAHDARLADALGTLDALSDDEVRALLAQRAQ
jgi:amino acid adenylation domain-containing protein